MLPYSWSARLKLPTVAMSSPCLRPCRDEGLDPSPGLSQCGKVETWDYATTGGNLGSSAMNREAVLMGSAAGPVAQVPVPVANATARASLQIEGMTCASCASRVEKALLGVPGVVSAEVNL